MKYKIIGTTVPAAEIYFDKPGELIITQSGGMAWGEYVCGEIQSICLQAAAEDKLLLQINRN